METTSWGIFILVLLGLICGSLVGIGIHNYKLDKCNSLVSSTNQDYYNYELQSDCYFVLEKTGWNLFWTIFMMAILGIFLFGFLGLIFFDLL